MLVWNKKKKWITEQSFVAIISATHYEELSFLILIFSIAFSIRNLLFPTKASSCVCPQHQSNSWNPTEPNQNRNLMSFSSILLYHITLAIEKPVENCQVCKNFISMNHFKESGLESENCKGTCYRLSVMEVRQHVLMKGGHSRHQLQPYKQVKHLL